MKKPGHLVYRQQWESLARGDRLSTPRSQSKHRAASPGKIWSKEDGLAGPDPGSTPCISEDVRTFGREWGRGNPSVRMFPHRIQETNKQTKQCKTKSLQMKWDKMEQGFVNPGCWAPAVGGRSRVGLHPARRELSAASLLGWLSKPDWNTLLR